MSMALIDAGNYPHSQGLEPAFSRRSRRRKVRVMSGKLIERIDERLTALGKTPEGASKEAGLGRDFIRTLRRRPGTSPRADNLAKLANALECSVDYLVGSSDEVGETAPIPLPTQTRLPILHEVAAGAWHAADEYQEEPLGWADANRIEPYARWRQWIERVVGDSYNQKIPDGALVHVVDAIEMGYEPRHGDTVVVVRIRAQGAFIERSVKEVVLTPTGVELWPRSYNPKWNAPLSLTEGVREHEDVEVRIVGKVIQAYIGF